MLLPEAFLNRVELAIRRQAGLTRNLSTAEIVDQVRASAARLRAGDLPVVQPGSRGVDLGSEAENEGEPTAYGANRISNVVFMGMGEALANYQAAIGAIRRLTDPTPDGFGISARGITMSSVGLVPAIDKLTAEGIPVTLALSLHAPDDELRDELVPINTRWSVDEAIGAAYRYFQATKRRVSIEYALIRDINDQAWRAAALGELLAGRLTHLNLIPLNPTPGSMWTASDPQVQDEFVSIVADAGVAVTVRDTRGREIDGACGQLAASVKED